MTDLLSSDFLIVFLFLAGYAAIIFEHYIKVNKAAVAIITAVFCWIAFTLFSSTPLAHNLAELGHNLGDIAQILFFLLGAMTIVELIDSHKGFSVITAWVQTRSKRKLLWIIAILAFVLSSMLDNLTTTILMISILRKVIPDKSDRLLPMCLVVVAANAGGAWTPIGDVTTTMLWIEGVISSKAIMKSLFFPSLISLIVPLVYFSFSYKGKIIPSKIKPEKEKGATLILILGVLGLVSVPVFKALTGLPPFMGILLALSVLWIVTDLIHREDRNHLKIPHVLAKIDFSSILFFLGILLAVAALDVSCILAQVANGLNSLLPSLSYVAFSIGLISAILDNVPLVAASIGMYPVAQFPLDHTLWHMIAYAAGTGGSMLIIGSSSGVALMGMEKVDFITYLKKMSFPVFLGYLAGMLVYLYC